jgi:hypothetical protein
VENQPAALHQPDVLPESPAPPPGGSGVPGAAPSAHPLPP